MKLESGLLPTWFQSSSGPSTGCDALGRELGLEGLEVSILIRPFDRMRPGRSGSRPWIRCFNPHPALRPDATMVPGPGSPRGTPGFNPHPALRPDATSSSCRRRCPRGVSILIRPFDRMRPYIGRYLARPVEFQSSSGPSTGCDLTERSGHPQAEKVSILIRPFDRMRPSSPVGIPVSHHVSILIRPFDRMRPA